MTAYGRERMGRMDSAMIEKDLRTCAKGICRNCPRDGRSEEGITCADQLLIDAANEIAGLRVENERLRAENEELERRAEAAEVDLKSAALCENCWWDGKEALVEANYGDPCGFCDDHDNRYIWRGPCAGNTEGKTP